MQNLNQNEINVDDEMKTIISIETIYELASKIGEQFKLLIQLFGNDNFEIIIPLVISVLENFEKLSIKCETYLQEINNLQKQINELKLLYEKRNDEHLKFQTEIEDLDELWRSENDRLKQCIKLLKCENNQLKLKSNNNDNSLQSLESLENEEQSSSSSSSSSLIHNNHQNDLRLENLQAKIIILNNQIDEKNIENDSLRKKLSSLEQENRIIKKIIPSLLIDNNGVSKSSLSSNDDVKSDNHIDKNNNKNEWEERIQKLEQKLHDFKHQFDQLNLHVEIAEEVKPTIFNSSNIEHMKIDSDLPVQGPIPKEPDDKYFTSSRNYNRKSRIWSFFPKLTKAFIK